MSKTMLQQLEERVSRLEEDLRQVKTQLAKDKEPEQPWWERIAGSHEGDKTFEAIMREVRRNRRAEYAAAAREADARARPAQARRKRRKASQARGTNANARKAGGEQRNVGEAG
ncbi:MAG TPA: hypothetical protein VG013_19745 [Gemmataceae bacterium]|jgi:hypothetical protein|nr:hypothetical protein [Gemmataceae bacterium]